MKHRANILEPPLLPFAAPPDAAPEVLLPPVASRGRHALPAEGDGDLLPADVVPARATWVARSRSRTAVSVIAALALAGAAALTWSWWSTGARVPLEAAAVLAGLVALAGAVLAARRPRRTELCGSALLVTSGRRTERFELDDLAQRVELAGVPGERGWSLTLGRPRSTGQPDLVLGSRDVDGVAVDRLVRHWRELAERRRAERWALLGL